MGNPSVITSLLDNDMYKFSMGQAIYHQYPGRMTEWEFKCRNSNVRFTDEMIDEIKRQVGLYCKLRFWPDELDYLSSIKWIKPSYVEFLRLWQPNRDDIDIACDPSIPCRLRMTARGTWMSASMYEVPLLAIVNEVYFRYAAETVPDMQTGRPLGYDRLHADFVSRLDEKIDGLAGFPRKYTIGTFSEFGTRRRLSLSAQRLAVNRLKALGDTVKAGYDFVGTSNVMLSREIGKTPVGTMAHEWIMCAGQGDPKHNPAYANWFALDAWVREYGVLNGIALTDTVTTECFLRDFQLTFATLFSGVRHDSGDPFAWARRMIAHYESLGIDPRTKTLLFSDSLDFAKATALWNEFHDKAHVAFGIGTYLTNDTRLGALNIVMKPVLCDGRPVAKLSDADGKGMCRDAGYVRLIRDAIAYRLAG